MLRRPRRNRKTAGIRSLTRQTQVTTDDLVFPLFLIEGNNQKQEVTSMPGIYRLTSDLMLKEIESSPGIVFLTPGQVSPKMLTSKFRISSRFR